MSRFSARRAGRATVACAVAGCLVAALPVTGRAAEPSPDSESATAQPSPSSRVTAPGSQPSDPDPAPPAPTPPAPSYARPDGMPALTDQQREELLGPGSTQVPVRPGTPMPRAKAQAQRRSLRGGLAWTGRYTACFGLGGFAAGNSRDQVLSDQFQWGRFERYKVGDGSGNINWLANPYRQVSWYMWLHSLRWLGTAIDAARRGDTEALDHVKAVARDWVTDNPYSWQRNVAAWESTMHRTNILLCLRQVITDRTDGTLPPSDSWLDTSLVQHAEYMKNHFSGYTNHGTDESLAMLGVAATLGRGDYSQLAQERLAAILSRAIDAEGATNEQSTGYAVFNYYLWGRVGNEVSNLLPGSSLDRQITARRRLMITFLAHSYAPNATLFQLGNTEESRRDAYPGTVQEWASTGGVRGIAPAQRVAVFVTAGYAFGRTTWGSDPASFASASAYALRFGPPRIAHGHHDHMSISWFAKGSPVLIDSGFGEYTKDAWEAYAKSPQAHNQLVIGGMNPSVPTGLTRRVISTDTTRMADYYQLVDTPGKGFARVRDVIVLSNPDVVLVVDRAKAPKRAAFNQLWHLPVGAATAVGLRGARAVSADGRRVTTILSMPYAGQPVPRSGLTVIRGSTRPVQGWFWSNIFRKRAAPVVSVNRTGTRAALVTVVTSGSAGARVSATSTTGARGSAYTITVGGQQVRVGQSPGGSLYRIR